MDGVNKHVKRVPGGHRYSCGADGADAENQLQANRVGAFGLKYIAVTYGIR